MIVTDIVIGKYWYSFESARKNIKNQYSITPIVFLFTFQYNILSMSNDRFDNMLLGMAQQCDGGMKEV